MSLPPPLQADNDVQHFQAIAGVIKQSRSGKKIGVFTKDNFKGPFVEGWTDALKEVKVSQVDVSAAFAFASAAKDDAEMAIVKVEWSVCRGRPMACVLLVSAESLSSDMYCV